MGPAPAEIAGLRVLWYTPIDGRHTFTGRNERRYVSGRPSEEILFGPMAGLAICQERGGHAVLLVGCDADWWPRWSTGCTDVAAAKAQAEFEYTGVSQTWVAVGGGANEPE
jgi:hypothetical protein